MIPGGLYYVGDVREMGAMALARRLLDMAIGLCDDYEERARITRMQGSIVDRRAMWGHT